jgi:hypothetical protein
MLNEFWVNKIKGGISEYQKYAKVWREINDTFKDIYSNCFSVIEEESDDIIEQIAEDLVNLYYDYMSDEFENIRNNYSDPCEADEAVEEARYKDGVYFYLHNSISNRDFSLDLPFEFLDIMRCEIEGFYFNYTADETLYICDK